MRRSFTLEYWEDEGGFVGRLKGVPGVFSQGGTVAELEENIRDAYELVLEDEVVERRNGAQLEEIDRMLAQGEREIAAGQGFDLDDVLAEADELLRPAEP